MSDPVIADLIRAVGGLESAVKSLVEDAREERQNDREYRENIRERLELARSEQAATRSEQQQLAALLDTLTQRIGGLTAALRSLEDESRDRGTIRAFVGKSAKIAWTLFGTAIAGLIAMVLKYVHFGSPPPGGSGSP